MATRRTSHHKSKMTNANDFGVYGEISSPILFLSFSFVLFIEGSQKEVCVIHQNQYLLYQFSKNRKNYLLQHSVIIRTTAHRVNLLKRRGVTIKTSISPRLFHTVDKVTVALRTFKLADESFININLLVVVVYLLQFSSYWRDGISISLRTWWGDEILWLIHKFINWQLFAKELPNIFKAKFHIINVIFALPCHSSRPSVPHS